MNNSFNFNKNGLQKKNDDDKNMELKKLLERRRVTLQKWVEENGIKDLDEVKTRMADGGVYAEESTIVELVAIFEKAAQPLAPKRAAKAQTQPVIETPVEVATEPSNNKEDEDEESVRDNSLMPATRPRRKSQVQS